MCKSKDKKNSEYGYFSRSLMLITVTNCRKLLFKIIYGFIFADDETLLT